MGLDPAFRSEVIQRTRHWKTVPRQSGCLWVHASSVGEVRVAELLICALQQAISLTARLSYPPIREPDLIWHTKTVKCPVFRFPIDLPIFILPLLKRLDPATLILIEAEYWPNLLHSCLQREIPGTPGQRTDVGQIFYAVSETEALVSLDH